MKKFTLFGITFGIVRDGGYMTVVIAGKKLLHYRRHRTPRLFFDDWKRRVFFYACFLQVWPVYFEVWSRDCDLCESTSCYRFPTFWHAHRYFRGALDHAEGPMHWHQVSRKAYKNFNPTFRDRVLEAFEDGRGTHTIIALALVVCASWLTGCSEADQDKYWPRQQYELFDGKVVECRWADQTPCGVKLYDCTDGQKYTCQTGVTER
jgi:hypothetical protein